MYCPVCGKDSAVRVEMTGGTTDAAGPTGVVRRCSKGHVIPDQVDDLAGFVTGDGEAADEFPAQFVAPGAVLRVTSRKPKPDAKAETFSARDALREIKSRRRAIAAEVKRLDALRAEDEELAAAERAIEAARRAKKVRPLRTEVAS